MIDNLLQEQDAIATSRFLRSVIAPANPPQSIPKASVSRLRNAVAKKSAGASGRTLARKIEVIKHPLRFLLLVMQIAAVCVLTAHAEISVTGPRCESAVNPLGIDAVEPHLSWLLTSSQRGQKQTAYQILVASDEDKLRNDQADIWNSGKVASDQSNQVLFQGPPLTSRGRVLLEGSRLGQGWRSQPLQ